MVEGLLSIQAGENPRVIEEKLKSFLSPARRRHSGKKAVKILARKKREEAPSGGNALG